MGSKIAIIVYYLPESILTNEDLAVEFEGFNSEKVSKKLGISSRHISAQDETAVDMAEKACAKLFNEYDKSKVDFLILCTQSPDYYLPTSACILQHRLGLRTDIGAFDYNLGCSGYVYGLALAKSLIAGGLASTVLLVTSETYSKFIHPKDRSNRTIFGDAATATIIESSDKQQIGEFTLGTDGSGAANLIVENGASRNAFDPNAAEIEYSPGNIYTKNHLYMNGPDIFNFTIESVPAAVNDVLLKNKATICDIDYVIFHQANKYMLDYLRLKVDIPEEKFYIDMVDTGNVVSSTIPLSIKRALEQGKIKTGSKIMLVGFGVGYSWAATVIEI